MHYEIKGKLNTPVPPIRESKYMSKEQHLELYRWMVMNRRMEQALENLYKQSKVVGGVYFGLGQEACSCASAYALGPDDWFAPMIRNQGAQLVRGFALTLALKISAILDGDCSEGGVVDGHAGPGGVSVRVVFWTGRIGAGESEALSGPGSGGRRSTGIGRKSKGKP